MLRISIPKLVLVIFPFVTIIYAQECAVVYAQCAGIGYSGPDDCCEGNFCRYQDEYYSQCIPNSEQETTAPTPLPTGNPTARPTSSPSHSPTESPSLHPTDSPTDGPTNAPSDAPSYSPTQSPSPSPSRSPTILSSSPSSSPTNAPTQGPTENVDSPTSSEENTTRSPTTPSESGSSEDDNALPISEMVIAFGTVAIFGTFLIMFFALQIFNKTRKDAQTFHNHSSLFISKFANLNGKREVPRKSPFGREYSEVDLALAIDPSDSASNIGENTYDRATPARQGRRGRAYLSPEATLKLETPKSRVNEEYFSNFMGYFRFIS
eukprot:snap_masked-scaffold_1-processed-gene-31.31-mRNA-1 protein AED:0.35 eAED:0.35 QI:0/0/0/0.5/1/1/2/0/320